MKIMHPHNKPHLFRNKAIPYDLSSLHSHTYMMGIVLIDFKYSQYTSLQLYDLELHGLPKLHTGIRSHFTNPFKVGVYI